MKEKKALVQSTIRVDEDLLYEAQFYLSHEKSSIAGFFKEKLHEFVEQYRQAHPDKVPGGVRRTRQAAQSHDRHAAATATP